MSLALYHDEPYLTDLFNDLEQCFFGPSTRSNGGGAVQQRRNPTSTLVGRSLSAMKLDCIEKDDGYVIEAEIPGYKKGDISATLDDRNHVLTIKAENKEEKEEKDTNYIYRERRMGKVERSIRLPDVATSKGASADFKDGVLRLTFPKAPQVESVKQIPIA